MKSFYLAEHQHKGRPYVEALLLNGFWRTNRRMAADMIFYDHDIGFRGTGLRPGIELAHEAGIPVFIIPHSARPNVMCDTHPTWPHTKALFTIGDGHKEVLEALEYPCPVEVTGWAYSQVRDFVPVKRNGNIKVLFAPIHPNANGFLADDDKEVNRRTFTLLMDTPGLDITVRYLHDIDQNGLWFEDSVNFINGKPNGSTKEIEQADVVISAYTHAYLTVAIGKPLIMMAEHMRPHVGNTPGLIKYSNNWEKYREIMRYPYEIENCTDGTDVLDMMNTVMEGHSTVELWKKRFIGKPFDDEYFIERLETYL